MISPENQGEEIDVELDEDDLGEADVDEDTTDWKAEAEKWKGIAKRKETKLAKAKEVKETKTETKESKTTDLGYGEKAYLVANGIKGADEIALVKEYMASGKELDDIIENKHFQNDLKDLREDKAVKAATPTNSKRSSSTGRDSVEYWIAKGELPPTDEVDLRRKVVNARMKAETSFNPFSKNPVVR